jgi:outer membrane protein assembly factor BamD
LFNSRYPNSERVEEAAEYISEMRSKLARKLYNAADLYMRTDQYEAAIIYYDLTIDRYPETEWAARALVNEINAYVIYADNSVSSKQRERYTKAVESYEKFIQLFPENDLRSKAEDYVDDARTALAELGPSQDDTTVTASKNDN